MMTDDFMLRALPGWKLGTSFMYDAKPRTPDGVLVVAKTATKTRI